MMEDDEHWEWYDLADVDIDASDIPQRSLTHGMPLMTVDERTLVWTETEEE